MKQKFVHGDVVKIELKDSVEIGVILNSSSDDRILDYPDSSSIYRIMYMDNGEEDDGFQSRQLKFVKRITPRAVRTLKEKFMALKKKVYG